MKSEIRNRKSVVSGQWPVARKVIETLVPAILLFGGVALWLLEVYGIF